MKTTVLIVDNDLKYLRKIVPRLATEKGFELIGVAQTFDEGLLSIEDTAPDILLTDFDLEGCSGLDLIRAARKLQPNLLTMIVTEKKGQPDLFEAIAVGAKGYVLKSATVDDLCIYIGQLIEGGSPISPYMARWLIDNMNALNQTVEGRPTLSKQELSILIQLSKGCSRDEMASINKISKNTVATYTKRIYKKLGVCSKTEAVFEGVQLGLITIK